MSALFDALRLGESRDGMLACNLSSLRHLKDLYLAIQILPEDSGSVYGVTYVMNSDEKVRFVDAASKSMLRQLLLH